MPTVVCDPGSETSPACWTGGDKNKWDVQPYTHTHTDRKLKTIREKVLCYPPGTWYRESHRIAIRKRRRVLEVSTHSRQCAYSEQKSWAKNNEKEQRRACKLYNPPPSPRLLGGHGIYHATAKYTPGIHSSYTLPSVHYCIFRERAMAQHSL